MKKLLLLLCATLLRRGYVGTPNIDKKHSVQAISSEQEISLNLSIEEVPYSNGIIQIPFVFSANEDTFSFNIMNNSFSNASYTYTNNSGILLCLWGLSICHY